MKVRYPKKQPHKSAIPAQSMPRRPMSRQNLKIQTSGMPKEANFTHPCRKPTAMVAPPRIKPTGTRKIRHPAPSPGFLQFQESR